VALNHGSCKYRRLWSERICSKNMYLTNKIVHLAIDVSFNGCVRKYLLRGVALCSVQNYRISTRSHTLFLSSTTFSLHSRFSSNFTPLISLPDSLICIVVLAITRSIDASKPWRLECFPFQNAPSRCNNSKRCQPPFL